MICRAKGVFPFCSSRYTPSNMASGGISFV
uniref:Uncharacterized protein n=1 Tax=Anguilla anguilla TaxID=7936 RepID=A0A0E9R1L4_ANGAN